jgi:hypothetical protein
MPDAAEITESLSRLTEEQMQDLAPEERQALADELRRVYRIIEGDRILNEARKATAPMGGVIDRLNRGERSL